MITIADFIREPLVEVPVRDQVWSDFWTAARHRNGTPPQIGPTVTTLDGLMEAVSAGLGVAISVAPVIDMLGAAADVVFRPLPELSPLVFWVARREHDDRHHIVAFLDAAVATLQTG